MKAAWENRTFHFSQELIYTLALFAFQKKKKKEKTLARLPSQMFKTEVSEFHFSFYFRFYIQFLGYRIVQCSPKPFLTLCTGSEEEQGKEWVITSRA